MYSDTQIMLVDRASTTSHPIIFSVIFSRSDVIVLKFVVHMFVVVSTYLLIDLVLLIPGGKG